VVGDQIRREGRERPEHQAKTEEHTEVLRGHVMPRVTWFAYGSTGSAPTVTVPATPAAGLSSTSATAE